MIEEEIAKKSRMKEKCTVRNVPTDDRLKTIRIELIGIGDDDGRRQAESRWDTERFAQS